MKPCVRTRWDGMRWLWRSASPEEIRLAESAGVPVHSLYPNGEQGSDDALYKEVDHGLT